MTQKRITVIAGDGIGPSLAESALTVLQKLGCSFQYDMMVAGMAALDEGQDVLPEKTLQSIAQNRVVLKGPLTTPVGQGFRSINVTLRQRFDLYANVRPVVSFPGTLSRYDNINLLTIRENTEGLYCGEGQTVSADGERAEAKSIVTRQGSERIVRFAFEMARQKGFKKVTAVHKANILKSTSGLFLRVAQTVAKDYPDIAFNDCIVDAACMKLVMNPHQFQVIVTTNLFGDILSDLCAGLVGGLGMAPGANIGRDVAIFEAVHGSAPDIAGKNVANPCSLLLAAAMMLDHLNMQDKGNRLRAAIRSVIENQDRVTPDLGGHFGTTDFTQAIVERL